MSGHVVGDRAGAGGSRIHRAIAPIDYTKYAEMPTDRPTFEALKDFLNETVPLVVRARQPVSEEGKMEVEAGDAIIVVDGRSENYWWKGQNQRTFEVGLFPRKCAEDQTGRKIKDISKPLKNSFIHTGHGAPCGGKTWGNPEQIDDVYLRNPMKANDLAGAEQSPEKGSRLQGRQSMRMRSPSSMQIKSPVGAVKQMAQAHQFKYSKLTDDSSINQPPQP